MKTLKDIVTEREPQYISNEWIAGVAGCPSTYTYLKEYLYDNNDCDHFENCYDCWNREVEEMHHERNDNQNYHESDEFRCSECGLHLEDWSRVVYDEDSGEEYYQEYVFKYCPECGTKIDGDK